MDGYRRHGWWFVLLGMFGLCEAGCSGMMPQLVAPEPRVLPRSPTLEQVIQVVNRNSSQIQSFSTTDASLSGPGLPSLRADVAFQRPRRFRLRASMVLTGPELDLGSNDELFWFWVKRGQPPGVYYCRHDRFATSRARQMIPVDPQMLIEALGVVEFDPAESHQGPFSLRGNRLEIRSVRQTAEGPAMKLTIIDASRGWVLQQHVYDAQGRLIVRAVASRHRRDPLSNLVMPTVVKLDSPGNQFSMRIDLGHVQINRLSGNFEELWTMPCCEGVPMVDLCDPNLPLPPAAPLAAVTISPGPQPPGWRRATR